MSARSSLDGSSALRSREHRFVPSGIGSYCGKSAGNLAYAVRDSAPEMLPEVKPAAQSVLRVPTYPHGPTGVKMTDHVQVTPGAGVEVHVVVKPA